MVNNIGPTIVMPLDATSHTKQCWLAGEHLLLLRDFGPYGIFMNALLQLPWYGDHLVLRDFGLYGVM
jgi:hypothetical protein